MGLTPQRSKSVDLEAIAKHLGVSKTTVHYALTNKGRVSQAVRERVLSAAAKMGYRPNLLARSLRTRQTHTIGVVLSSLTSSFHAHLLETIDQAAQENEYSILFACSYRDIAKELALVETLLHKGVDGLIVAPLGKEQERNHYHLLLESGAAIVFVDRDIANSRVDSVAVDNFLGGRLAGDHLIQSKRRRLAFVTMMHGGQQSVTLLDRMSGFNYALQSAGLDSAAVLSADSQDQLTGESFGFHAVASAIRSKRFNFDGIFAANDNLAYGAIKALSEAGLRVPKNVAVVGFDDQDSSAFVSPPLTTVRQPVQSVGACAVDLILKRIRTNQSIEREPQRIKIEPVLVKRQSA